MYYVHTYIYTYVHTNVKSTLILLKRSSISLCPIAQMLLISLRFSRFNSFKQLIFVWRNIHKCTHYKNIACNLNVHLTVTVDGNIPTYLISNRFLHSFRKNSDCHRSDHLVVIVKGNIHQTSFYYCRILGTSILQNLTTLFIKTLQRFILARNVKYLHPG